MDGKGFNQPGRILLAAADWRTEHRRGFQGSSPTTGSARSAGLGHAQMRFISRFGEPKKPAAEEEASVR